MCVYEWRTFIAIHFKGVLSSHSQTRHLIHCCHAEYIFFHYYFYCYCLCVYVDIKELNALQEGGKRKLLKNKQCWKWLLSIYHDIKVEWKVFSYFAQAWKLSLMKNWHNKDALVKYSDREDYDVRYFYQTFKHFNITAIKRPN